MEVEVEEWRDIEGYGGDYQVSNLGRVRSFKSGEEKILKPVIYGNGYFRIGLHRDKKQKLYFVHRLVASAFIDNPEGKPQINHIDGVKTNNRVDNLEWVTSAENIKHAFDTGLIKIGEDNVHAKFSNEQVEWIRDHYLPHDVEFGIRALARRFNVVPTVISEIVRGKTYSNAGGVIANNVEKRKLTEEQVLFVRENYVPYDKEFGTRALGMKFDIDAKSISKIVRGSGYKEIGGTTVTSPNTKGRGKLSDADMKYICENYKPRTKDFGSHALGRMFGVAEKTIRNIVRGKTFADLKDLNRPELRSYFTDTEIDYIRQNYKPRDPEFGQTALAKRFGVGVNAIKNLVRGNTYSDKGGKISPRFDNRKLTDDDIRYIRQNCIKGDTKLGTRALARKFGVSKATIQAVLRGKTHRDVI